MSKITTDALRAAYTEAIATYLSEKFECDVCKTATGTLMIPAVDNDGEDRWVRFVISVPNASEEDGTDGYSLAQEYEMKLQENRMKAEAKAKEKAEKLAKAAAKKTAKAAKTTATEEA